MKWRVQKKKKKGTKCQGSSFTYRLQWFVKKLKQTTPGGCSTSRQRPLTEPGTTGFPLEPEVGFLLKFHHVTESSHAAVLEKYSKHTFKPHMWNTPWKCFCFIHYSVLHGRISRHYGLCGVFERTTDKARVIWILMAISFNTKQQT